MWSFSSTFEEPTDPPFLRKPASSHLPPDPLFNAGLFPTAALFVIQIKTFPDSGRIFYFLLEKRTSLLACKSFFSALRSVFRSRCVRA